MPGEKELKTILELKLSPKKHWMRKKREWKAFSMKFKF